jgi:Ca2+-binding EF-hand superfamily protein
LDTDNSGSIDTDELEEVLKHLGVTDPEERERQVGWMLGE